MEKSGGFTMPGRSRRSCITRDGAPPKSTIQFPGGTGGVNWGGAAADPTNGIVYVNAHDTSLVGWVEEEGPGVTYSFEADGSKQPYDRASVNGVGPFFTFSAPLEQDDDKGRPVGPSLPCQRPPWARAGGGQREHRRDRVGVGARAQRSAAGRQADVGSSGSAGPTVTAGGLVFVGATNDRRFRAFDAKTGKELWTAMLDEQRQREPDDVSRARTASSTSRSSRATA